MYSLLDERTVYLLVYCLVFGCAGLVYIIESGKDIQRDKDKEGES